MSVGLADSPAAGIIAMMIDRGWSVRFSAGPRQKPQWRFHKFVTVAGVELVRSGIDRDLYRAAEMALDAEERLNQWPITRRGA